MKRRVLSITQYLQPRYCFECLVGFTIQREKVAERPKNSDIVRG
jgi:hypothetical protein